MLRSVNSACTADLIEPRQRVPLLGNLTLELTFCCVIVVCQGDTGDTRAVTACNNCIHLLQPHQSIPSCTYFNTHLANLHIILDQYLGRKPIFAHCTPNLTYFCILVYLFDHVLRQEDVIHSTNQTVHTNSKKRIF